MAFLSKAAFSMEDFLLSYPRYEFVDVDENIQGVALVRSYALAHLESVRAGSADYVPARHAESVPGERSVLAKDGVLARTAVAVLALVLW